MASVKIITGDINSGKTTLAAAVERKYSDCGKSTAGYLTEARIENGRKTAYYLRNIPGGEIIIAVSEKQETDMVRYGFSKFYFSADAFLRAEEILKNSMNADVVFIDEIGPLELNGMGFCNAVKHLLRYFSGILILVVRESLLDKTIQHFELIQNEIELLKPERW